MAEAGAGGLGEGAVAVIDALGFKGIWRKKVPADVIATLKGARADAIRDEQTITRNWSDDPPPRIRLLSDSAVITCMTEAPNREPATAEQVTFSVVRAAAIFIVNAVGRDPALVYRGCVAFGPLLADDDFFVGPAMDEAAEWANKAEAGVVWLLPSAEAALAYDERRDLVVRWDVPLKGGSAVNALFINPLTVATHSGPQFLAPFDRDKDRIEVLVKKQNTEKALKAAEAHRAQMTKRGEELRRKQNAEKLKVHMAQKARKP